MRHIKVKNVYCSMLFLLFSFHFTGYAQEWSISLKPALSIATGEFAAHKLHTGSFAQPGFNGSLSIDYTLYKGWKLALESGLALHAVDVSGLGLITVQSDPFMEDVYIRSEAIRNIYLLAGANYTFNLPLMLHAEAGIKAGVMRSETPYQLYKPRYFLTGPEYYEITSAMDYSLVVSAEMALLYPIKNCYETGLGVQWLSASPAFEFNTSGGMRVDKRPVKMINIAFVWRFHL
ncbi:MAG: hypothetical protein H0S84_12310 [Bacteroidales bacterium]|nr:hypothetical protein [Bacteroidales bacterium]MDN5349530.1 hypothetical protein [Bacteroidales bacterium]